jgi:hypothetical protein
MRQTHPASRNKLLNFKLKHDRADKLLGSQCRAAIERTQAQGTIGPKAGFGARQAPHDALATVSYLDPAADPGGR